MSVQWKSSRVEGKNLSGASNRGPARLCTASDSIVEQIAEGRGRIYRLLGSCRVRALLESKRWTRCLS